MLNILESSIDEFCESGYFLMLDPSVKEHGLGLLTEFFRECKTNGAETAGSLTMGILEKVLLTGMAKLALPVAAKKGIPSLCAAYFKYLSETGKYPPASEWEAWISAIQVKYLERLRDNGTIKAETFKKNYTDVNRNDPCPCGSGKKFKKCCMTLISN